MIGGGNVDPALIGGAGVVLAGIIIQLGNLWSARQTRTLSARLRKEAADDELVRWERERGDRQAQWQAEQEARAQNRERDDRERRHEWLREHRRAAAVSFMARADEYRVAQIDVHYKHRHVLELGEPIARYMAARYEMALLFEPNMAIALDAQLEGFGALGRAVTDSDWDEGAEQLGHATTLVFEAAKLQIDST